MPNTRPNSRDRFKTYEREYFYIIRDIVRYQTECDVEVESNNDKSRVMSVEIERLSGRTVKYSVRLQPMKKFDRIEAISIAFDVVNEICTLFNKTPRQFRSKEL